MVCRRVSVLPKCSLSPVILRGRMQLILNPIDLLILVAGGGAPGDCDFSVGGTTCPHTCTDKKPNIDPSKDPEYKEFKDLYECIEKKCVVQLGACKKNKECNECCKLHDLT